MLDEKQPYEAPSVTRHGTVEELTQQGGGNSVDVPIGTPANTPGGITGTHI